MTDQEYADLKNRARTILKMLEDFPAREFLDEERTRGEKPKDRMGLGQKMWAAYLEGCC